MKEAEELIVSAVMQGRETIKLSFLRRFARSEEELAELVRLCEEWGLEVIE